MTHEVTLRRVFAEALDIVDTAPDCRRDIASQALNAYNLAAIDEVVPVGLWPGAELFARRQVADAVTVHLARCACVSDNARHGLEYRPIPFPRTEE